METPTLMETLNHDNIHVYTPHQCFYISPFDINGKGYQPLGLLPLTELSLVMLPLLLHIIFVIPMTVNDVNLSIVFRGVSGLSS
jgi:hypothetical protein